MNPMSLAALLRITEVPVLVKFGAVWCSPCKAISPIMEQIAVEWEGDVDVWELDVDEDPESASQWLVRSIPTLILIDSDGTELDRLSGSQSKASIERMLYRFFEDGEEDS